MALYKGYSSISSQFTGVRVEDIELVKRDLLNHFGIRRGEKLMNPKFGTSIHEIIMEPLTEETKNTMNIQCKLKKTMKTIQYNEN